MVNVDCAMPEIRIKRPFFDRVTTIPSGLSSQIQMAVIDFIASSGTPDGIDKTGFYNQTLQAIASASVLNQGGDLWLGVRDGELYTYILARIGNDFDGQLAYVVSQAWVRKDQRGKPWVKEAWNAVRQRAKDSLCKHFAVYSTKGRTDAYCRFLGKGFQKYCEILKSEI